MILSRIFLLLIFLYAGYFLLAQTAMTKPSRIGVEGNKFVTEDGALIVFRGLTGR